MDDLLTGVDKSILDFDEKFNIIHRAAIYVPLFSIVWKYVRAHVFSLAKS